MKQLHFTAVGKPELLDVDPPSVPADGMLLRTRTSGLSNGTERAQMMGETYNQGKRYPVTPGYQAISEIVEVGPAVERFQVGDLVYTATFGTHAQFHVATEESLIIPLPADADLEALVFLAVAAVSLNDVSLTQVQPSERLLVIGAGPIGQFAVQAARIRGAQVTLASRGEARLRIAEEIGPVRTIVAASTDHEDLRDAGPFDVVAECSGSDNLDGIIGRGFGTPKLLIPRGGRLVLVAGRGEVRYNCNAAQGGKVTIYHCTHCLQEHLAEVLDHFLAGRMQSRPLIQDIVPAAQIVRTYDMLRDRPSDLFGTVFVWD
ncbi:MAG: zinc-binding alcohol dehydrogenase [Gemmatimonadetes bacterium]|jgi:2-desacetyl-2-hydroxyethyl bacteriochlorophyllide A dehydrogenase|nr:zinc-binding alcohol dehydrogenase [Gemmatimonadota bacterium]MBT6148381.1 zinc-binding alcohol dehydrogenase [Gemmatimonadota bacterium]MBT7862794.1 zinc-binding alcohol dehydrogenase [Gemmatimonadota bacterium]